MKRVLSVLAASLFMFALALPTLARDRTATTPPTKSIAAASTAKVERKTEAKAHVKDHTVNKSHHHRKNEEPKA
jgi:hypothetical protein